MIENTLDHELAHYAHQQRLTVAWLRRWNEVAASETVNVTHYVENMHSDNPVRKGDPALEDLAESSALYMNRPGRLLSIAPERFSLLNERDKRYDMTLTMTMRKSLETDPFTESMIEMIDEILKKDAEHRIAMKKAATSALTFALDEI